MTKLRIYFQCLLCGNKYSVSAGKYTGTYCTCSPLHTRCTGKG